MTTPSLSSSRILSIWRSQSGVLILRLGMALFCRARFSLCRRLFRFPADDFQIKNEDAVKDGHQEQRDERCHGKAAYLCITKRLPKGPSFKRQWEQGQDGREHSDHYGADTLDACVRKGLLQRLPFLMHFLDEIEEYDDVAYDHSD